MGKFLIENILIEKTDKDIKTGEKYSLNEGFNLICGDNEAGKSSLMNFLKQGFFKTKGIDTGKIYFKINENSYRADIKDAKSTEARCKLYDETNSICDYELIEKNIKQKYFEEGFTINLDDLMKIQNKETEEFINIIKDPSNDKLSSFLKKINDNIAINLSLDNKLKKNAKEITDKIANLNLKIKELSSKENEYNNNINTIKSLNEEITTILKKEDYIKQKKETDLLFENQKELVEERISAENTFNKKLYEKKEEYIELIQSVGEYNSNIETINKCNQKNEIVKSKILQDKTRLNIECGLSLDDETINSLSIEHDKILKIKELIDESRDIVSAIKLDEQKVEDLENTLLKLKCEIENILENKKEKCNFEELELLTKSIEESLRQYHFISSEIDTVAKETILNADSIRNNKKLQILLGILFLVTIICAFISFYQKVQTAGIFSILMAILAFAGFSSLKLSCYGDKKDAEKERKIEQREKILFSLKEKVKNYYPEIVNIEDSYLPVKLDSLKQELQNKVNEFKLHNETILKNATERNYTEEKLLNLKTKISNSNNKLNEINNEINNLSDKKITNDNVWGKKYLDAVEIIKDIKNSLEDKKLIDTEINETKENNERILAKIKSFIVENAIDIAISENINETITEIKKYNDKNHIIKQHIDALNMQIDALQEKLNSIQKLDEFFVEETEEELIQIKEEKFKQKKEAEFKRRELEKVEGISELKTEKNLLIEEYRTMIKNLFVDKMTIELTSIAKAEFDKTQPDLLNAQKYLAILTDNKYTKINLELQELENENGTKIKKWEYLSRGTKEQLYLALRLGYASNYSKDKITLEPNGRVDLPLIIDDAFVNFDAKRTKNALKCLLEFSKTNQVLFFTCHTEMITKMMKELENENLNIIQL